MLWCLPRSFLEEFTAEYSSWFDLLLPGLQHLGFSLPLGGTSNHFRAEVLRALGGWDAFNVTEDCELGLRLSPYKMETVILDSTTYEEANSNLGNWFRQRSRWIKGYMQTYLAQTRHPLSMLRTGQWRKFLALHFLIGGRTFTVFINPILWAILLIYILFRSRVEGFYQLIFPAPVLYLGTICLVVGNFIFLYSHLVGCLRLQRYNLVKWTLGIPIYWAMMSVAAIKAFAQLITKPHYWEKTIHGLHFGLTQHQMVPEQDMHFATTVRMPQLPPQPIVDQVDLNTLAAAHAVPLISLGEAVRSLPKRILPAFSSSDRQALARPTMLTKDLWYAVMLIIACIMSILATSYFISHHMALLYVDAYSHLRIARAIIDSATPGFAQIGGVWLPLPQLLMLPFVWNNYLWKIGLAGSIPQMLAYVFAANYLFRLIRRFTHNSVASFIGTLVFLLNPNVLYLQSTALTELICLVLAISGKVAGEEVMVSHNFEPGRGCDGRDLRGLSTALTSFAPLKGCALSGQRRQ
ncbi:MAG TPA: glycosyltransferase family 2 protein [Ktedonosporobacter sp.]|nr:glycosyltransferase family 2 protein [Ktedonosporobacter sp.]